MSDQDYEAIKITTEEVTLEIISEPYARFTHRGYAPVVNVKVDDGETKALYISSSTLAKAINPMVENQDGKFLGLKFSVKKESDDKFAKYEVKFI